jgi:hypothetical protein
LKSLAFWFRFALSLIRGISRWTNGVILELAARCVLLSEGASTEIDKIRFLDMAQWWSNLADKVANSEAAIDVETRPLGDP